MNQNSVKEFFIKMSEMSESEVVFDFVDQLIIPGTDTEAAIKLNEDSNPIALTINKKLFDHSDEKVKLSLLHEIGHIKHGKGISLIEGEFLAIAWVLNKVHAIQDHILQSKIEDTFYDYGNPEDKNPEQYIYAYNKAVDLGLIRKKWENGILIHNKNYKGHPFANFFEMFLNADAHMNSIKKAV